MTSHNLPEDITACSKVLHFKWILCMVLLENNGNLLDVIYFRIGALVGLFSPLILFNYLWVLFEYLELFEMLHLKVLACTIHELYIKGIADQLIMCNCWLSTHWITSVKRVLLVAVESWKILYTWITEILGRALQVLYTQSCVISELTLMLFLFL